MLKNKIKYHIKKISLPFLVLFVFIHGFSQENKKENKLSVEFNMGSTTPFSNLTTNYYANYFGFLHLDLGSRYMLNEYIGAKLDFGFDRFKNDEFKVFKESWKFQTFSYRANIQGVINIGKILRFSDWTNRIGILAHGGAGISILNGDSSTVIGAKNPISESRVNLIMGFTPQIRLTNKIAISFDLTFLNVLYQKYNFDFRNPSNNKFGMVANISGGMTYYIGKNKTHVDWNYIREIEKKDTIITPIIDSTVIVGKDLDKDGILNDDDLCPEEFGLSEFQGCPKPEITFDCFLNEFPVFVFNKARFELLDIYSEVIDSIAKCMLENSTRKIIIYGHTDKFGDSIYTQELSYNRANKIREAIILKGISGDRIFAIGESTKKAILPEKESLKIKHNRVAYIESISNNQNDIKDLESGEFVQGLFFTVQIGAYQKAIKNNKFKKFGKVLVAVTPDKLTRYSIDIFQNYQDAYDKWKILHKTGIFSDAYVTAYFLGERITIKKAQELLLEKGNGILEK